jgi:hypothetical protein
VTKRLLIAIAITLTAINGNAQVIQTFAALGAYNIFTAGLNTFEGILATNITDSALTAGNCVQASTSGLLVTTSNPCGSGSGTVTSITPGTGLNSSPNPITTSGTINLNTQYTKLRCETGLGDGLNAMAAGTYLQSFCYNDSGVTWTITGIKCYIDGGSSSTLNASGNTLGALLTGAIACSTSFASGTQTANVALTSGDYIKFTFVADGTAKQSTWVVSMSQ